MPATVFCRNNNYINRIGRLITWNGGGFDLPVMHYGFDARRPRTANVEKRDGDINFRYNRPISIATTASGIWI